MAGSLLRTSGMFAPAVISLDEVGRPGTGLLELLTHSAAVRCPRALSYAATEELSRAVLGARDLWTPNFGGKQFTLGRAYYTHLEEDREGAYFADASGSDQVVQRAAPGLQQGMLSLAARALGEVARRPGWCGAGVHIFPPRGEVARRGGEVHFDTEGLTPSQIARRAPAVSMVLMLQPAQGGGGLRIWDRTYAGDDFPEKPAPSVGVTQIAYEAGEVVFFDSYRLHQILPFRGSTPRVSATLHACLEDGRWQTWF